MNGGIGQQCGVLSIEAAHIIATSAHQYKSAHINATQCTSIHGNASSAHQFGSMTFIHACWLALICTDLHWLTDVHWCAHWYAWPCRDFPWFSLTCIYVHIDVHWFSLIWIDVYWCAHWIALMCIDAMMCSASVHYTLQCSLILPFILSFKAIPIYIVCNNT
jgi:hypothetical protein